MVPAVTLIICISAIYFALGGDILPWVIIGVCDIILLFIFAGARSKKYDRVDSLSDLANAMIAKYGHFYVYPNMSRAYAGAAALLMFCGVVVGAINAYRHWWYGLILLVVNWMIMGYVSRTLNPIKFLKDDAERAAHDEVIRFKAKTMGIDLGDD